MSMDRAERAGFGASVAGHLLFFAIFYWAYTAIKPFQPPPRQAIEVDIVADTAFESGVPELSAEAPAPKLSEVEAPIEPEAPPPTPVEVPKPVVRETPKPTPAPTPKPAAREPAKPARPVAKVQPKADAKPARPGGRLAGILDGISSSDSPSRSSKAPAATITPAIQSSLAAAIIRQIKPHWEGPNGPDVDALKTVLKISLARDGSVTGIEFAGTSGINATNRSIAPIHRQRAEKAVRLASPFQLPANLYDGWKEVTVNFDWRL